MTVNDESWNHFSSDKVLACHRASTEDSEISTKTSLAKSGSVATRSQSQPSSFLTDAACSAETCRFFRLLSQDLMLRSHRDHSRSLELCRPWSTTRRQCSRPVLAPSREYMLSASTRELMCLPSILLCSLLTSAFARQLRRVVFRPCEVSLASPKRDRSMWR